MIVIYLTTFKVLIFKISNIITLEGSLREGLNPSVEYVIMIYITTSRRFRMEGLLLFQVQILSL